MIRIGIDPGPNNGAVAIQYTGTVNLWTIKHFANTPYYDIDNLLKTIKRTAVENNEKVYCLIEQQIPFSPPGVKIGVASIGKLMEHFGLMKGLLMANHIPYVQKVPRTWMKLYGLKKGEAETKTQWKNRLKQRAKELEPDLHVVLDNADAILIALVANKFFE